MRYIIIKNKFIYFNIYNEMKIESVNTIVKKECKIEIIHSFYTNYSFFVMKKKYKNF